MRILKPVPRLWSETIDDHRRTVGEAIMTTTATLVTAHGLAAVTMSQIATETGIGRATLYKYFPDVESILIAWHDRQVGAHLHQLTEARDRPATPSARIAAVLTAYALIAHERHDPDLSALLHRGDHMAGAHRHLHGLVHDVLAEGVAAGEVRDDIPTGELAHYCLHALGAARDLPSAAAVRRLVALTLDVLRVR